jgi:putative oxidoreductase
VRTFPFIKPAYALIGLRVVVAGIFIAHAMVRWVGGTIERFGGFLDERGFVWGVGIVWALTVYELVGGVLMALGIFARWLALFFFLILLIGIVIIHFDNGWFVGEHGTGGMEYSVLLMAALLVIAATDNRNYL